jgi:hypothetical protein
VNQQILCHEPAHGYCSPRPSIQLAGAQAIQGIWAANSQALAGTAEVRTELHLPVWRNYDIDFNTPL